MSAKPPVCVIGGAGFVGRHIIRALLGSGFEVRALRHRQALPEHAGVQPVQGDLRREADLRRLLASGSIAINLAYLPAQSAAASAQAARTLAGACQAAGVRRLVHLSTAVVAGRTADTPVTELTACHPRNDYEIRKLETERALGESRNEFELVVVRPTAVFGSGGRNLQSMIERLRRWPPPARYALASLHGRRLMNVVPVETVAAAAVFLATAEKLESGREVFLVSEDDDPLNNYRDIEDIFIEELGVRGYSLPVPRLDRALLGPALRLGRRSNINPYRRYSSAKLRRAGFSSPVGLEAALRAFAAACAS